MFNSYRDLGNYRDNVFLTDLFANGAYVDQNTFPDTSTRQEVIVKHINALALNWAWHKTRCWVASFPMSQADCMTLPSQFIYHRSVTKYLQLMTANGITATAILALDGMIQHLSEAFS